MSKNFDPYRLAFRGYGYPVVTHYLPELFLNLPPPLVERLVVGGHGGGGRLQGRGRRRRRGRAGQEGLGGPAVVARLELQLEDDGDDPVVALLPKIFENTDHIGYSDTISSLLLTVTLF